MSIALFRFITLNERASQVNITWEFNADGDWQILVEKCDAIDTVQYVLELFDGRLSLSVKYRII